jgi:hypothetical protein
MTPQRAMVLAVVSLVLIGGGAFLISGYQYAHLHKRVQESYAASEPWRPTSSAAHGDLQRIAMQLHNA